MDAGHLAFPDESFDVVVAQYVITTVPNPEAALNEFARVLKPGGEIVLVSRVGAEAGLRRVLEKWFARRRESSAGTRSSRPSRRDAN
jgi:phosphatidylethanolamine/phosphatidyl-N-methylethanolamine N-methyltransferase